MFSTSPPGFYYSPPGNGKSTSIDQRFFVGIDTDWLVRYSSFSKVVLPFLTKGIPVVTNQYSLCIGAQEKLVGSFNSKQLRTDEKGHVYTSYSEILNATKVAGDDFTIFFTPGKFFSSSLILLYRSNYIYNQSRLKILGGSLYDNPPPQAYSTKPWFIVVRLLEHADSSSKTVRYRRRRRARIKD